jgi:hypothetical protein
MMCCVAYISCQRTEQSASSRQLIYAPAYLEHTGAKGSKLLVHSRRHVCQRKPNEWKEVNDILILTNITLAAAGAGVCDYCRSRLAIAGYRNRLRKNIKTGIFRFKELHTLPQNSSPKSLERATIWSAAELFSPQVPRPGVKKVPYKPKDQHHV